MVMQSELMEVQRKVLDTEAKITETHGRQERLLESATRSANSRNVCILFMYTRQNFTLNKYIFTSQQNLL